MGVSGNCPIHVVPLLEKFAHTVEAAPIVAFYAWFYSLKPICKLLDDPFAVGAFAQAMAQVRAQVPISFQRINGGGSRCLRPAPLYDEVQVLEVLL